jgi:hypothetical protein
MEFNSHSEIIFTNILKMPNIKKNKNHFDPKVDKLINLN